MIREYPLLSAVILAILLIAAYFLDELKWKLKSDQEIIEMTRSTDPKRIMVGLDNLKKRKKDISGYIHVVLPFLIADSVMNRVTAKMIIKKHYTEDYSLIKDYSGSEKLNNCKETAGKLFAKYKVKI
jgi:hypothetical protein